MAVRKTTEFAKGNLVKTSTDYTKKPPVMNVQEWQVDDVAKSARKGAQQVFKSKVKPSPAWLARNAASNAAKVSVKSSVRGNALTGVAADMLFPESTSKKADLPKNQGRARALNQIEVKAKRGKGR